MSESLQPRGLYSTRLFHPWDFPGKNNGTGCHFFLQGIFPTQESNYLFGLLIQPLKSTKIMKKVQVMVLPNLIGGDGLNLAPSKVSFLMIL